MAKLSGTDLPGFDAQLKTTKMFYTPKDALAFMTSPDMPKIMDLVRTFSFEHNLARREGQVEGRESAFRCRGRRSGRART